VRAPLDFVQWPADAALIDGAAHDGSTRRATWDRARTHNDLGSELAP
jgi:hypothetical protein